MWLCGVWLCGVCVCDGALKPRTKLVMEVTALPDCGTSWPPPSLIIVVVLK